ncbi:MAG: hypothetical protein R2873_20180 [Caldilineaceae bacterium]
MQNDITFKIITSVQIVLVLVTLALIWSGAEDLLIFLWARVVVASLGCVVAIYLLRSGGHSLPARVHVAVVSVGDPVCGVAGLR